MSQTISFFVTGEPKAQPRPKAFARNFGGKWMARVYTPGTAEAWKSAIADAVKPFLPLKPFSCPFRLNQFYYFARPKSHFRTGKNSHLLRDEAPKVHISKPDCENLQKALQDALTQVGFWTDDAIVYAWGGEKYYCDPDNPRPGCFVALTPLTTPESQPLPKVNGDPKPAESLELFGGVK